MSPELREIVEKAYRLFSDYRPGPSIHCIYDSRKLGAEVEAALLTPVSYTHLTLPTICSV